MLSSSWKAQKADCLSRVLYGDNDDPPPTPDAICSIAESSENYPSMDKIRTSQLECPELHEVIKCLQENKQIEAGPYRRYNNLQIIDGLLHKGLRVIVPDDCQEAILKELHGQHHVGAPNTLELCKNRFY